MILACHNLNKSFGDHLMSGMALFMWKTVRKLPLSVSMAPENLPFLK